MRFYDVARKVVEGIYRLCFRIRIEGEEISPQAEPLWFAPITRVT